jgi:hypothetical protein
MRPMIRRRRTLLLVGVLLTSSGGCRPLYLPPVPDSVNVTPMARLGSDSGLRVGPPGGALRLHLVLLAVPQAGWLAVQWFAPDGREAASDSVWVTPQDEGQGRTLGLPANAGPATAGEWRAVVSMDGVVLRQFRLAVPEAGSPSG